MSENMTPTMVKVHVIVIPEVRLKEAIQREQLSFSENLCVTEIISN